MNKNENGFTLIELLIAISIISLLTLGVSQLIKLSVEAYNISNESNEYITKTNIFLKRIEAKLKETEEEIYHPVLRNIDTLNNEYFEIEYRSNEGILKPTSPTIRYFFDKTNESIMENSEYILRGNKLINTVNINVKNCKFYFFKNNINNRMEEVTNILDINEVNYIRIELELEGVTENINYKMSTGIAIK